ncbi:MAG: nucleoside-triphosphatase [Spirochaetales bacterium]|nr:nucleoside-triphosphatase [Spirochaetales bacterium]
MSGPLTILLTGESGSGKTLTASRLVEARPQSIAGVLSVSESKEGVRRAIVARLLPDGGEVALASLERSVPPRGIKPPSIDSALDDAGRAVVRLGPWDFSVRGIERVNHYLCRIAENPQFGVPPHSILIDEIGPLELVYGGGFLPGLRAVLDAALPSVIVVRPSLVDSIRAFLASARGAGAASRVSVVEISHSTETPRVCDTILAMLDDSDVAAM